MGITSANAVIGAALILNDVSYAVYSATTLGNLVTRVAHEISARKPLGKRTNLALIEYTWDVDLGSLDYLCLQDIIYPTNELTVRRIKQFGSTLQLQITDPAPTITSGTLTGTVTFTQNSRSVTGSGTAFSTELSAGYLLCKGKVADAAYKWYRILSIESDTALTLVEPFEESTGADTVSLTKYRDYISCVRINYGGTYTVSTTSDMPTRWDDLLILGVAAHAATEFIASKSPTSLATITTDYGTGKGKIGSLNIGGDEATKYALLIQQMTATAQMISSYKSWSDRKWMEYQQGLKNITPFKIHEFGSTSV